MVGRHFRLRVARALRFSGLTMIACSLAAAGLRGNVPRAIAAPLQHLGVLVAQAVTPPAPQVGLAAPVNVTPSPAPSATPGMKTVRGGPLTFLLTGSLTVGQTTEQLTQGDPSVGGQDVQTSTTANDNAGLLAHIQRRTASTTLDLSVPAGLALHESTFGQLTVGYYTPKYALRYGPQALSLLGGVPLGSSLRGPAFVLPIRNGDVTFFNGPAAGNNLQMMDVDGMLARLVMNGTLLEFGADVARSKEGESASALVAGATRSSGLLTQTLEGALETTKDEFDNSLRTYSYQYRADYGSNAFYGSATMRRIGDGFISFGSGVLQPDEYDSASLRSNLGTTSADLEASTEKSGTDDSFLNSNIASLTLSHTIPRLGLTSVLLLSDQKRVSSFGTDWTGGIGSQLGFSIANIGTTLGAQFQRSTLSYGDPQTLVTYSGNLQRQFGTLSASASYQGTRQIGGDAALQSTGILAVTQNLGPTSLTLSATEAHIQGASDVVQLSPELTVARRISPAATLAVTYGEQFTKDLTDPSGSGHNRIFSIQIAAPFAIGSGIVQGRVDPRLPATITGSVTTDSGNQNQFSYSSSVNGGVGNVVVVLDNSIVQRTDLAGQFQFNFVSPGIHQVRLETSSLPRGVTVDQPYAAVSVQGGQTGQILFRIGTYGAIAGHVLGHDMTGQSVPLDNVMLQLDGAAYAHTDAFGAYGFGRLTAGKHTIEIIDSSLPASASFAKTQEKQIVTVLNGQTTPLDFLTSALGSIAGFVTFDPSLAPALTGGVMNAYIVAEPGDYSAITNADGSFLLDNVPAGAYTIDVDPETLPDETGNSSGTVAVTVAGDDHKEGVNFSIGRKLKTVVFTLKSDEHADGSMSLSEPALPPGGSADVVVDAGGEAASVTVTAFEKTYHLVYNSARRRWIGTFVVPAGASAGTTTIDADVKGSHASSLEADLKIDPAIPLVTFKLNPAHPTIGQYVTVHARFLVDIHPGDAIRWLNGDVTKLSRPISGRVYTFTVKTSERLMRGLLLTRQGQLPIVLR